MNAINLRVVNDNLILGFLAERLDGPIRVQCGHEALEVFRAIMLANKNPWVEMAGLGLPEVKFEIEPTPYRHNGKSWVLPYVKQHRKDGLWNMVNPEWLEAKYEAVIGYGTGCMFVVCRKREIPTNP